MAEGDASADQTHSFLSNLGFRVCMSTVSYPIEYAKFLIQIGHEPLPPFPTRTLFGRPAQGLPNVFRYVQYIKNMDGWTGCYRGFIPRVTGQILGSLAATDAVQTLKLSKVGPLDGELMTDSEKVANLKKILLRDIVGRSVTIVVSQPFVVIASRMMAEFVGGEDRYSTLTGSVTEIFREQGIVGFFSGLVPRWLGEMAGVVISTLIIYSVNNYVLQDNELKSFTTPTIQFITNSLTYPFCVVASCMSVNDSGLQAGIPPNMPIYKNWVSCWRHLSKMGHLNRGSSVLFRYYFGPPNSAKILPAY